jgi:serine/threonine protein phosphatase PrpC
VRLTLNTANAGDARIVLGYRGLATRLTKDHRTDDPDEVQRIETAGGFMFKGRVLGVLAVTRSLGDHCMKDYVIAQPFLRETTIELWEPGDGDGDNATSGSSEEDPSFLILACDGLWDVMEDQQAVDFVLKYENDKANISKHLINEALRRGTTDNVTVVVAWL